MKRSTAVRHLREMAEVASERLRLRETNIGWPLEELWASGDLLTDEPEVDAGAVVLTLDVPADELPWLKLHATGEWIGDQLRLGKRPMSWAYRPLSYPAWNHDHRRVIRFWSASEGADEHVLDALREGDLDTLQIVAPTSEELRAQLQRELPGVHRELSSILDSYWDDEWRRRVKIFGVYPEDHLWRAASAIVEMTEALDRLSV